MAVKEAKIEKVHKGMFFELDYGKDLKIDNKDKKIISILGENCRIPVTTIGRMIHASKDSVRYRIKELEKKNIYRGNNTIINPFVLGFPVYTILVKLKNLNPEKEEKILSFFEEHPFAIFAGQTQGDYDFNVVLTATDITHFDKLLREIETKLTGSVKELNVLHITKMLGANTVPLQFVKENGVSTNLDKLDSSFASLLRRPDVDTSLKVAPSMKEILILKAIAGNANLSLQEISEKTKVKPDTVKNTIKDLIRKKVIIAFRGAINVSFLKYHGYIAYFKLYPGIKEEKRKEFEDYFRNSDSLAFGTSASGSYYDEMIYLYAKDPLDFNKCLTDIKNKFSDIIEEYSADLILKDYKFTFFPEGLLSPVKELAVKIGAKFGF